MEDINALELLKEEMSTEEIHLKVNAIHRLKIVVLCLGQADSVSQLLPYLDCKYLNLKCQLYLALVNQEDDEVLFAIAEELGKVWELHNDKTVYLPLLEKLAKSDETVVREQAARSLISISEALTDAEIQNVFTPLVIRLA
jgi:serine/threonine-protein phosphatase 2A regulatory subunit A